MAFARGLPSSLTVPETGTVLSPAPQPSTSAAAATRARRRMIIIAIRVGRSAKQIRSDATSQYLLISARRFAVADGREVREDLHVDIQRHGAHGAIAVHEHDDVGMEAAPAVFALVLVGRARGAKVVVIEQRGADRLGGREAIKVKRVSTKRAARR